LVRLNKLLAFHSNQDIGIIEMAMDRDKFMDAEEAIEFGLIDSVLRKRDLPVATSSK